MSQMISSMLSFAAFVGSFTLDVIAVMLLVFAIGVGIKVAIEVFKNVWKKL